MRFENPNFSKVEPIIEDENKKVFVDPESEDNMIFEFAEVFYREKETPAQLKGSFYLTKIVHDILPKNIPDINQIGEDKDGLQTMDRPRVAEKEGDRNEDKVVKVEEVLHKMGLANTMDPGMDDFIEDENGNIQYIKNFRAWEKSQANKRKLVFLFEEKVLRRKIAKISDEAVREECLKHLDRVLTLFKEEQEEISSNLLDSTEYVNEFENIGEAVLKEDFIESLMSMKTEAEALNSADRKVAQSICRKLWEILKTLKEDTNISPEEYDGLYARYKTLHVAIGVINRGILEHR